MFVRKTRPFYVDEMDGKKGVEAKILLPLLVHLSRHLVVLFSITHIVCCKLPRFGHRMAGQMQQTADDN